MQDFSGVRRIVVKVGTNTLTGKGGIDAEYIRGLSGQVAVLLRQKQQVLIVTSGAIGMGAKQLSIAGPVVDTKMRQACAAVGQPLLMHEYHKAFNAAGIQTAQVLLTAEVLSKRKSYLNLRNSIETLLNLGIVPILNENDPVSTDEIGTAFGDNDKLSALVASKIDADLLILLTDIDALYDKDPRKHPDAQPIGVVNEITESIIRAAGGRGSVNSTGGMKTKLAAAKITSTAGCWMVLADGRSPDVLERILAGDEIGTLFIPKTKLGNRRRWILHSRPEGTIFVDDGAMAALHRHKSLLPSGIVKIEGTFTVGSVVMINDRAKAVVSLSSAELRQFAGSHSSRIRQALGDERRDVAAVPEDIIFLDQCEQEQT